MKKIVIITSKVTFVPKNYEGLISAFLNKANNDEDFFKNHKIHLVFLDNSEIKLIFKALTLILIGAPRIGFSLLKNYISANLFDDRKQILKDHQIPYYEFSSPNTIKFRNFLRSEKIDILINARTRFIYKKKTLHTPKLGAFNIHHGLLPDNRGTMCDLWAMYQNTPIGFTIHQMNEKIDDGRIIQIINNREENALIKEALSQKNYSEYIYQSSLIEGESIYYFIKDKVDTIEKKGIESVSIENTTTKKSHFRNPKIQDIWKMKKQGIKL